jgi:hypothetical protein
MGVVSSRQRREGGGFGAWFRRDSSGGCLQPVACSVQPGGGVAASGQGEAGARLTWK